MSRSERAANARERLEFLNGMVVAIDRRTEVIELVAESESADEARAGLTALLGVSAPVAQMVLNLQIRRLAKEERNRIADERESIRQDLLRLQ